jgi:hypothetical protein
MTRFYFGDLSGDSVGGVFAVDRPGKIEDARKAKIKWGIKISVGKDRKPDTYPQLFGICM